jgi:hypothetical protein
VANGAAIDPAAVSLPVGATYQVFAAEAVRGSKKTDRAIPIAVRRFIIM